MPVMADHDAAATSRASSTATTTVTDCYVVAGYIDPAHFLGGRLKLDPRAARRVLERVADVLGVHGDDRAERVALSALRITTAVMASEIARDLAQRGEDARDYALIAFGGAGPTQGRWIWRKRPESPHVVIPAAPSTFCVLGAILADVKRDFVASRFLSLADASRARRTVTAIQSTGDNRIRMDRRRRRYSRCDPVRGNCRYALCGTGVRLAGASSGGGSAANQTPRRSPTCSIRRTRRSTASAIPTVQLRSPPSGCASSARCRQSFFRCSLVARSRLRRPNAASIWQPDGRSPRSGSATSLPRVRQSADRRSSSRRIPRH